MGIYVIKPLIDAPAGTHLAFVGGDRIFRKTMNGDWVIVSSTSGIMYESRRLQSLLESQPWALS